MNVTKLREIAAKAARGEPLTPEERAALEPPRRGRPRELNRLFILFMYGARKAAGLKDDTSIEDIAGWISTNLYGGEHFYAIEKIIKQGIKAGKKKRG